MAIFTISAWAKAFIILFKYSEFGPLAQGCRSFKIFDTNDKIFEIAYIKFDKCLKSICYNNFII